jgi:hypothetical protein
MDAKCIEASASVSVGGRIQIVKFEYSQDFHFSMNRKYEVPSDWSEDDVKNFQKEKCAELRAEVEVFASAELNDLINQRDEINS